MRDSDIDYQALLANALGITVEKLQEAAKAAADARLAQAVTDGKITQEQVDLMKAQQALRTYIQEKGFYAEAVKQAVADGVITQAQADAILSKTGAGMRPFGRGGFGGHGGLPGSGTQPQSAPLVRPGALCGWVPERITRPRLTIATRSQVTSTSLRKWELRNTLTPVSRSSRIRSRTSRRPSGSRPEVGSSNNTSAG